MSFDQKFTGKLVWGTSVWRIHIEPVNKKMKSEFEGKATLYERRHEKSSHEFSDLQEFVDIIRKLWKESLRSDTVQDTRMARWIEEYFSELGIQASYMNILKAIRGKFEETPPLEVGKEETLDQDMVTKLIPEIEDIMVSGTRRKIQGDLGDSEEVNEILENFLDENKPERRTEAKSKATFTTPDGEERTITETTSIEDMPLDDQVTLDSGFANDFGSPIEDIQFTDTLPYDYEIQDVKISGVKAEQLDRVKTKDGLQINWKIDRLEVGEKSDIKYDLGKRMLRTILIRDDRDLTILQTYEDIHRDEQSAWIESTYIFQEKTPVVENVKILDQIPGEYKLVESKPDAVPPLAQVRTGNVNTEISWSYMDVPAQTQFVVTYELGTSLRILRDKIQLVDKNDELVGNLVRILRPLENDSGFGVIIGIETLKDINQSIKITDSMPLDFEIEKNEVEMGTIAELDEDGKKSVVWKLDNLVADTTIYAYLIYRGNSSYKFDKLSISSDTDNISKELTKDEIMKGDKINLPVKYFELIEN